MGPPAGDPSRGDDSSIVDIGNDPRRARLFVEAARGGAITARRAPYYEGHAALVAVQFREHLGAKAPEPDDARLRATALLLVSGLAQTLGVWLGGDLDLTREQLAEHFARVCVAAATTLDDEGLR